MKKKRPSQQSHLISRVSLMEPGRSLLDEQEQGQGRPGIRVPNSRQRPHKGPTLRPRLCSSHVNDEICPHNTEYVAIRYEATVQHR